MDPNIRYVKNGTVYFDGPFCKPWPRKTHPNLPQGEPVVSFLDDCFKMICDNHSDAEIIEKLNELKGLDADLIWHHITLPHYSSNIIETFKLTRRVCHLLAESHHNHLVTALWNTWTSRGLMPYLEKIHVSPNWSKEEQSWNRASPLLDLVKLLLCEGQEIDLCNAKQILESIPERLKQEFSESHHEKIQEKIDSYWLIFNYLWLDLKGISAFEVIQENGQIDPYLFCKMIDLALQNEESIEFMITFLENLNPEDAASFRDSLLSFVVNLPKSRIAEGFNAYKKIFVNNLDEHFYDAYLTHQLEVLSTDSVTSVLGNLCAMVPCPAKTDLLVQVCQKISDLIIKNKMKLDSIFGRWIKLTTKNLEGHFFDLDHSILGSFEKKIPKAVSTDLVVTFTTRLAVNPALCVKSITLLGQVILGNSGKKEGAIIPQETIRIIGNLNPKLKYDNVNRLLKALSIICTKVDSKGDKKTLFKVILFLLAEQKVVDLSPLNEEFWQNCYVTGNELGFWKKEDWRALSSEMYKQILIKEFLVAKGKLNGQRETEEQHEIIHEQVRIALEKPEILKERVITLIQNHAQKVLKRRDRAEINGLVTLLLSDSICLLLTEKKDLAKIKKELIQLVEVCVEDLSNIAIKIAETCVFEGEMPLWEVILRYYVGMIPQIPERPPYEIAGFQLVLHRFEEYVKTHHFDVNLLRDMYFSLGGYCCNEPLVATTNQLLKLRQILQYHREQDNPVELLTKFARYLEFVDGCISITPEDESEVLFAFYQNLLAFQKGKDNSIPNLQISLLKVLTKMDPGSTQTLCLWMDVIQSRHKHTKHAELKKVAKSFFKYNQAKVVVLFETLAKAKYFNCTNLIILVQAWCAAGDYTFFRKLITLLHAFIKYSHAHAIDLPSDDFNVFVRDYFIPLYKEISERKTNLVEILNMFACIIQLPVLNKSFSKETHLKLLKVHRKGSVEVIRRDCIDHSLTLNALDKALETLMIVPVGFDHFDGTSMALNAGNDEVYKRQLFVKEFMRRELDPIVVNLSPVLSVGIESFSYFLSLLDMTQKLPYKHEQPVELATFKYIDWKAIELSSIHIPFKGEQKFAFVYQYIKSLMRLDLEGRNMPLVMIFYIWESIKGFKRNYPSKKKEYEELCLDFVFFPNYMSLINQHLHWILCYASHKSGMFADLSPKNLFLIKSLLDPKVTVTLESKKTCESFGLTEFIQDQGGQFGSLFVFDVWDCINVALLGGQPDGTTRGWCRAFYDFIMRLELNTDVVRYFQQRRSPKLMNILHTMIHAKDVFSVIQKTHIAGFLAKYQMVCINGTTDPTDKAAARVLLDYYLGLPLESGWVKVDDPIYIELLAKLN